MSLAEFLWYVVLPLAILAAVVWILIKAGGIRAVIHRILYATAEDFARVRRWAWRLIVLYVLALVVLYIVSPTIRAYAQEHWRRTLIIPAVLLALIVLLRPWRLGVPARIRRWALQAAVIYTAVVLVLYWINADYRGYAREYWLWVLLPLAALLLVADLARPRGLELYKEYPENDEQETIANIINLLLKHLKKQYTGRLTLRGMHPKSNGLVKAEFEVLDDLPAELRVGLFAEPGRYPCWMRFSNAEAVVTPDDQNDFRGLAIKVVEPPEERPLIESSTLAQTIDPRGEAKTQAQKKALDKKVADERKLLEKKRGDVSRADERLVNDEWGTQDFLFIAHDAFFAATPKDFLNFLATMTYYGQKLGRLLYFIPKRLRLLGNALVGRRTYGHPFEIEWFSCALFRFGDKVVKYKITSQWPGSPPPDRGNEDYLGQRLAGTLSELPEQGHTMEFMIQFQEDPNRDLIENTGIPWRVPEFRTVARLHIPRQEIGSKERLVFDENMTFNPWHSRPEHRPVGGVNRARRDVMRAIQEFRLAQNGAERTDVNNSSPDDAPAE